MFNKHLKQRIANLEYQTVDQQKQLDDHRESILTLNTSHQYFVDETLKMFNKLLDKLQPK